MKNRDAAVCFPLLLCSYALAQSPARPPVDGIAPEIPKLASFDPSLLDKTKNPCTDFYQYTCSKWIAANPIPPDRSASSVILPLYLYNQTILRDAMMEAADDRRATGSQRQIGDFWQSCMDEAGRDAHGRSWLQSDLKTIDAMKSSKELARVTAYLHLKFSAAWQGGDNFTESPLFGFGPAQDLEDATKMVPQIDQGGMALPSLDYYLDSADRFRKIRAQYATHVQGLFELAGDTASNAAVEARTVVDIERAFARASMDNVTRRDPAKQNNRRTLKQLIAAVPDFQWNEYFEIVGAKAQPFYIVTAPGFLDGLEQQIKTRSLAEWRTYFRWWAIHEAAPYLGSDFQRAHFAFFGTALNGVPQMLPLWRRCVNSADRLLGEALGQAYVKIAFPPESKQRAEELVRQIRQTLDVEINQLDWMSDRTKKEALIKERSTLQKIGYPDKWIDYSAAKIVPDNYLANLNAANAFEMHRQIEKIGKPVDRLEWAMLPDRIDAYEDTQMNTINFPAGILHLPLFTGDRDDASNFGAIGSIIGHEVIHGFDDEGRKFDAKGNLRDWWTPEDAQRYDEKERCIVKQYSQEIPEYGVKQNGKLTAGEDTADNGGVHLAMLALENIYKAAGKSLDTTEADGLTGRQRFFLSFAFSWCQNMRPEAARNRVAADVHSLPQFRVDRPLSNMPEFKAAFACEEGQPMVHEQACRVW